MKAPLTVLALVGGALSQSPPAHAQTAPTSTPPAPGPAAGPSTTGQAASEPAAPTAETEASSTPAEAAPSTPPPVAPVAGSTPSESETPPPAQQQYEPTQWAQGRPAPAETHLVHDQSQAKFYFGGGWEMTLPVGSSADFASVFGVQSANFQFRYLGLGRASFGGLVAWDNWSTKGDQTTTAGNVTIGGIQARGVHINPLYARAQLSLFDIRDPSSNKIPVPYAAFNLGGAYVVRRLDMGISALTADSWHWALAPEIGVELPLSPLVFSVGGRFNYLFASGDGPEQLYFSFVIGLGGF